MHIVNCVHPIKIKNPYTQEYMYVRCGKCDVCRNSRAKRWVDRLNVERSCHPFTMFLYLDYDNAHLPQYELGFDPSTGESMLTDSKYLFTEHFDDYCIPFSELVFDDENDREYFQSRLIHPLHIPHGDVRDIQLFLKRFNKFCHDKITQTYRNFRYFIVCEYGPTTHRPHYHGLMFVDHQEVADRFREVLSHSWRLGHSDFQLVESSASSYVAQYLNCDAHLPSFYAHPKIRPFFLCSRQPPIGSLLQSQKEVREIFDNASPERVCRTSFTSTSLSVVPLLPSLKSRLFPKLARFGSLSHTLRVALYGLSDAAEGMYHQDFEGWKKHLIERCFPSFPIAGDWFDFSSFVHTANKYQHSDVARYICLISDNFAEERPLRELFRISNRVIHQCQIFGVSLDYYVSQIEKFYDNMELYKLRIQYNTQNEILSDKHNCVDDLVHMYPIYRDNVSESLSLKLDVSNVPDYKNMLKVHAEIRKNNTKTSKKNAYFESKLKKQDSQLYSTIKKFYYGKKRYEDAETLA